MNTARIGPPWRSPKFRPLLQSGGLPGTNEVSMVWDDPDFQAVFHKESDRRLAESYHLAQQALVDYDLEVSAKQNENGLHAVRTVLTYSQHMVSKPAGHVFDWFHELCDELGVSPSEADYARLWEEIDALVARNVQAGKEAMQRAFLRHRLALGHVSDIDTVGRRSLRDMRSRIDRQSIATRRRSSGIFISHINEDAPIAMGLQEALWKYLGDDAGVFVSSDYDSIRSGSDWHGEIVTALRAARVVIVLISQSSCERPWINYEAGVGDGAGIDVIPVVIRGFSKGDLKPPLSRHHARSLSDTDDVLALLRDLANCIGKVVEMKAEDPALLELREEAGKQATPVSQPPVEALRNWLRTDRRVQVHTVIPNTSAGRNWWLDKVTSDLIKLTGSSGHFIEIPVRKILDVYPLGTNKPLMIQLDGRIQWKDPSECWVFLPDPAPPNDPLGIAREVNMQHPDVNELIECLRRRGLTPSWKKEYEARSEPNNVAYDDDGNYLCHHDRSFNQVLVKHI